MHRFLQRRQTSYLWVALVLFALAVKAVHACMLPAVAAPSVFPVHAAASHTVQTGHDHHAVAGKSHAPAAASHDTASCCEADDEPVCGTHCADGEQLKLASADFKTEPSAYAVLYVVATTPLPSLSPLQLPAFSESPRASVTPPLTILFQVFTI